MCSMPVAGERCSYYHNEEDINDLGGSFHRQSRIPSFSFPDLSNGTYWMTLFELLHRKSEIAAFGSTCLRWVMLLP